MNYSKAIKYVSCGYIKKISSLRPISTKVDDLRQKTNQATFYKSKYDCVVIGLGAMGSSTLYHLAKRNVDVLGLEKYKPTHTFGSSHGLSRIIRLAYFEHHAYVDMLKRAFTLWDELGKESGRNVFTRTGSLDVGLRGSKIYEGSKYSCTKHKLNHTLLDKRQLIDRFPGWNSVDQDVHAVFQPDGGVLNPEECISAHVDLAKKHGATVNENESVLDVIPYSQNEVLVRTKLHDYITKKVVLSSGAWLSGMIKNSKYLSKVQPLTRIADSLKPQRNVVIWYKSSKPELYQPNNFPVFCLEYKDAFFYGFPIIDTGKQPYEKDGFKIGKYNHRLQDLNHELLKSKAEWRTNFDKEDEEAIGSDLKVFLRDAYGPVLKQVACIFTNTPDEHFIIDSLPDPIHPNIAIISACSGHGFKFSSMIGESMAELITTQKYSHAYIDWLKATKYMS